MRSASNLTLDYQKSNQLITFTEIEKKVLLEFIDEKSSNEIALKYNLGIMEVDQIRKRIMQKTGVRTLVGLTKYVMQNENQLLK